MSANFAESPASASLWEKVRAIAVEVGVELFDIDFPSELDGGRGGVLRIYITRPADTTRGVSAAEGDERRPGVSLEDCALVSKKLLDIDEQEGIIPDNCTLEVSSPGINRRLRRPDHFRGAVGERIKVKCRVPGAGSKVVTGTLQAVNGDSLEITPEDVKDGRATIAISEIKEARVDFKF
jgi:ribosome maturation factor RimP